MKQRTAKVARKTKETDITLAFTIDGKGKAEIDTGNGFMDHMLTLFARHGLFDMQVKCSGDLEVDFHHSAEDIGICLGQAAKKALGDMRGIIRYAHAYVPMDESLARVCLDICGRTNLSYQVGLTDRVINNFECDLVEDFLKAFCDNAFITMHVDLLRGRNSHHSIEALFKAFGRALTQACAINARARTQLPSTKGVL
ncbi:MAG: imidazoleglycerol-phosphate dehydratase HisB [Chitinivibrionales bacterium]|nr:imidazoleglycerol-phosphate dehydratase HisB [Chitinivibrionales bacterium]